MLVLFRTVDPAHPDKPMRDRLINERAVIDVEPVFSGEEVNGEPIYAPIGSIITLVDKRKVRVPQPPRAVQRAFKTGTAE
ncbi:MAG: hypothetical protein K0S14_1419 [Thermomicrobiales bacterium]|jgi:hypothetical protein|nr:hypothetical protein [Thermomicrobiales bacterium]